MMILEVTPDEFAEIADMQLALPDILFASWLTERFGERCPDLRLGVMPVEVRVVRTQIAVAS